MTDQTTEKPLSGFEVRVGDYEVPERAEDYLLQVLRSGRLSHGPFSKAFELAFGERHGAHYTAFCNSGTSALHTAIACLKEIDGWEDGDEILVPAVTFVATSNMVILNALNPVFVDVDSRTYNIDPDQIESKISERTRAILPVHLFGQPAQMSTICDIAQKHDLRVIEDSAETMFASHQGKPVGAWGDLACFSTYVAHMLITGVGGFVLTNDPEMAKISKSIINHGRDSIYLNIDDQGDTVDERLKIAEGRFNFVRFGHSFRATEFEAAVGLAQLEEADTLVARRKTTASRLIEGLSTFSESIQLPWWPEDTEHAFMMFPIVIRDSALRKLDLIGHLERNGIETRDMMPLLTQPIYVDKFGLLEDAYPVAKWINASGFYIGCHPYMGDEQVDHVLETFRQFFKRV